MLGSGLDAVEKRLNRIGMGYMRPTDTDPHAPVSWVEEEHNYMHPFSLKKRARDYSYNKLKEVMSLETYLNLPADMLETLIDGIRIGNADFAKDNPQQDPNASLEELAKTLEDKK